MLEKAAVEEDFEFINLDPQQSAKYSNLRSLVGRDGVHYTKMSSMMVGEVLCKNMCSFLESGM